MPVIISSDYLDRLCAQRDYMGLVWISSALCGSRKFDQSDASFGLPLPFFCLVERLTWFAQGIRSGAWTYFEATPIPRQSAMLESLRADTLHQDFTKQYEFGMREWRAPSQHPMLDDWIDSNDNLNNQIAWQAVIENREQLQSLANFSE